MNMQQLREAFAAWRKAQTGQAVLAYNLVWLLTDPTPITEEGLRELGFEQMDRNKPVWVLGDIHAGCENGLCAICGPNVTALAKSMGTLRLLLLSVGE